MAWPEILAPASVRDLLVDPQPAWSSSDPSAALPRLLCLSCRLVCTQLLQGPLALSHCGDFTVPVQMLRIPHLCARGLDCLGFLTAPPQPQRLSSVLLPTDASPSCASVPALQRCSGHLPPDILPCLFPLGANPASTVRAEAPLSGLHTFPGVEFRPQHTVGAQ